MTAYALAQKKGYPSVQVHTQVGELIDGFRHNQEVYVELLAQSGCSADDRESLQIVYQPFSEILRQRVQKRGKMYESDADYFSTRGDYLFGSRRIRIFAGHNLAWDDDEASYVDTRSLNNTLLHETGHFVDNVINGKKGRHISERAADKVGIFGLELARASVQLGKGKFIEQLHPFYLGMPLQAAAIVAGAAAVGSLTAVVGDGLMKYTYSKSPIERFANNFQQKHEAYWIIDGSAPVFNIVEAVKKYALSEE